MQVSVVLSRISLPYHIKTRSKIRCTSDHKGTLADSVNSKKCFNPVASLLQTFDALPCKVDASISYEDGRVAGHILIDAGNPESKSLAEGLLKEIQCSHPSSRSFSGTIQFKQDIVLS